MARRLLRTHAVIEEIEKHLVDTGSQDTVIEYYLTQHALVVLYADVEQEIREIVKVRVARSSDAGIKNFISAFHRKVLPSIMKAQLADFVKLFGTSAYQRFNAELKDEDVSLYNNVIMDRHEVAHATGVNVSFPDLKRGIKAAINVLDALENSIN